MSNFTLYFGAQPGKAQTVSEEVKAKGLNLLRIEPSKATFVGLPLTIQPNFAIYKAHLPLFMKSALTESPIDAKSPFVVVPHLDLPLLPIVLPQLVVTFGSSIAEEVRDQMRENGWKDIQVRGKPALKHPHPTLEIVRDAIAKKCYQTSPAPENCVNIFAFKACIAILRILSLFLRTHQYPAFEDQESYDTFLEQFKGKETAIDMEVEDEGEETDKQGESSFNSKSTIKGAFKVHLPVKASEVAIYYDEHTVPKGPGLLFPYIPELAQFDRYTVPETIKKYFINGLGDDEEACMSSFADLVSAWGIILNTEFGNQLSHLFKLVDITMSTQACMHPMISAGAYDGVFLRGVGYSLKFQGEMAEIASSETIAEHIKVFDKHSEALWGILKCLEFATEEDRITQYRTIQRGHDLKKLLDTLTFIGGTEKKASVMRTAKYLRFPKDREVEPSASNIADILEYATNPQKVLSELPYIDHTMLFSNDRVEIAWAAFGNVAPSFRVPGGKQMDLNAPFRITNAQIKKAGGPSAHKDIKKIGAIMLPLELAISHLKATIKDKMILNPYANNVIAVSTGNMVKQFENESCEMIIGALRKGLKITVVSGAGTKRKNEDEAEGSKKRQKGGVMDI